MSRNRNKRHNSKNKQPKQSAVQVVDEPQDKLEELPGGGFDPDYPFADVNGIEQGIVDERQLTLLVKDWRKGRATRSIWNVLTDGYVAIFTLVVVAAMVISAIRAGQRQAAGCTAEGCVTARELLPWLVISALWVAALAISRIFGPIVASAAEGFWLLDAPLRRSRILARRMWGMIAAAFVIAGLVAALFTSLTGLSADAVIAWTAATGITTAAWIAFAAAEQGSEREIGTKISQVVVGTLTVVVLVGVIATASGWISFSVESVLSTQIAYGVIVIGLVLGIIAAVIAWRRLDNVGRAHLVSGGELVSGMQGAAFALDFALMRDILVERRNQMKGHVKPQRGRGLGTRALVWRDVQRLRRNPVPLVGLVVSIIVPYALESLGIVSLGPTLTALVLLVVMVPFFDSMRVFSRTKGLARLFPMSNSDLRTAATIVPASLAVIWAIAVTPAFMLGLGDAASSTDYARTGFYGLVTAAAGLMGAVRWVSAKSADYNAPMVSTGAGAVPPGLMFNLVRGIDLVVVITFPLVMGWSPWISIIIAMVCWAVLRSGGINQQEMMEQQEEQRKQLAEMRAQGRGNGAPKQKQVVTRSTRTSSGTTVRKRPPLK